jgi:hypothetical protein
MPRKNKISPEMQKAPESQCFRGFHDVVPTGFEPALPP